jgi:UDP-N-acetylmuramoylalanine-D-glutamate ligase
LSAASSPSSSSVAVYGLSTEGYRIASSIAVKGSKVSLIDESVRMAISLKPDIARTYPNVSSLVEDEPLLDLEPVDIAISNASYVYFAPKIRKVGPDVKGDVTTKFKDAIKALKRSASVVYMLPTGVGGNNENIALIEHITDSLQGYLLLLPANEPHSRHRL